MNKAHNDFVLNYIEQGFKNATAAYRKAYPKCKSDNAAKVAASRLLGDERIQERIQTELASVLGTKKAELEYRVFDYWYRRMTFDPSEIIGLDGKIKITEEDLVEKGFGVCIDSINRKLNAQGDSYIEYKFADRDKAADMLSRYIQMIKPQPLVNLNVNKDSEDLTPEEEKAYQEQLHAAFPGLGPVESLR